MVAKSNFKQKSFSYNCLSGNTLLVAKNILKNASGKNLTRYLQTVLRLSAIQKQETPKTINCNFCC